jgi:hypothetical protein
LVDSYFTLEECERVLVKLYFTLKFVKKGYRYYEGIQIPMYHIKDYLCKVLGLELWTFAILASEGPFPPK